MTFKTFGISGFCVYAYKVFPTPTTSLKKKDSNLWQVHLRKCKGFLLQDKCPTFYYSFLLLVIKKL
jgi:hypothetical protein